MPPSRRSLLRTGATLGLAGSLAGGLTAHTVAAEDNTVIGDHTIDTDRLTDDQTRYRFLEMTDGQSSEHSSGALNKVQHGAGYTLDGPGGRDIATCAAVADAGWGSWTGTGRVGTYFKVEGSDPARVVVNTYGQYNGLLSTAGSGGASSRARLILENEDSGAAWRTTLFSESYSRIGYDRIKGPYNDQIRARLVPGHWYRMWAEIWGRIEIQGMGLAGADFGPEDGDDRESGPPNGLDLSDFGIWPRQRWNDR